MAPFTDFFLQGGLAVAVYLAIGVAFGAVLEMAGFGDSRRLAAQFYLRDMTVLKVMFTAIVTAMVLVFTASAAGILDFNRIWVPPTYLLPGIVGGLVMGVGFIIGGFCPGTSIVAVSTLKLDGLFFFLGVTLGIFVFGETVSRIELFWNRTALGRFTLPDWLGVDAGWVVVGVVLMAVLMFRGAEALERAFGGPLPGARALSVGARRAGVLGLLGAALVAMAMGQPTPEARLSRMPDKLALLESRQVQIHPGELRDLMLDHGLDLVVLDVRDEADFNLYHLVDSRRVTMEAVRSGNVAAALLHLPANSVVVLVSNGEERATEAWRLLAGQSVLNLYLLEGGMNAWLDVFGHTGHDQLCGTAGPPPGSEGLAHRFSAALGARYASANPDLDPHREVAYERKVKLQKKVSLGGGCG